jgi:hypothetical protein
MLRAFTDPEGGEWEVTLGRESWGAFFALFVPRGRVDGIRQTLLEADSADGASRDLAGMNEVELRRLFERSEPR